MPSGLVERVLWCGVVLEPDNCFALFYFVINARTMWHFTRNNNVNTLFSNPEIPGFGLS